MAPIIRPLLAELREATSYADLKRRLASAVTKMDPTVCGVDGACGLHRQHGRSSACELPSPRAGNDGYCNTELSQSRSALRARALFRRKEVARGTDDRAHRKATASLLRRPSEWVAFSSGADSLPAVEVINDASRDVATFFRVLQRHYQALVDMMRWQLTTRVEFQRLIATNVETLTDLERSARFFYLPARGIRRQSERPEFALQQCAPARWYDAHRAPSRGAARVLRHHRRMPS